MKHMFVPMEIKAVDDVGRLTGYASIFGNVDLGGDVIARDEPFKEIVRNPSGKVVMLFSHDSGSGWAATAAGGLPIGLADVEQNSRGLKFDAQLVMDDVFVRDRLHPQLKARTIAGMSIGYDILPGGASMKESGIRELTALKLWEISVVLFAMNPKATIDSVKTIVRSRADLETAARELLGLSKSRARRLAHVGWPVIHGGDDEEPPITAGAITAFADDLNNLTTLLKGSK
jgi:HK97 family phage prohead protease